MRASILAQQAPLHHSHATRYAVRRRREAMESMSPATKAVYEFLKADLAESLNARFKRQDEETTMSMRSFVGDLMTRIDDLKMSIGVDMDELCAGLDRPPAAPMTTPTGRPPQAEQGAYSNADTAPEGSRRATPAKGKDHVPYVPPPARGTKPDQSSILSSRLAEIP